MPTTAPPTKLWHAALCALLLSFSAAALSASPTLQIYFIDVAGGQSTLIVTPRRETMLVDAGFAGAGQMNSVPGDPATALHANRIVAAMRDAGVTQIDYLWVTHFHRDHIGGIPELAKLVPIKTFVDHGNAYPPAQRETEKLDTLDVAAYDAYVPVRAQGRHLQPRPGDPLPLKSINGTVVSADRATLTKPLRGAGESNSACRSAPIATYPGDENPRSNGFVLQFGKFRFLDVGDLSDKPLYDLVCPRDLVGALDVYLVAHHGGADVADPATLKAFRPRVAIINNGPRKGGRRALLQMLRNDPSVATWQLHLSIEGDDGGNAPLERVANVEGSSGHWLKVTAKADGSFQVLNSRDGSSTSYAKH